MQHLASDVNLFCKIPSLLNNKSSVAKISFSTVITICFYFFPQLFKQIHRFSIEIFIDEYVGSSKLVYFLQEFYLVFASQQIVYYCFCFVFIVRIILSGSHSISSQSSHVSPGVSGIPSTLKLFLLDLSSRSISFCSTQFGSI